MIRLAFYLLLTVVGLCATLVSPFAGAVTSLSSYLLNPPVITQEAWGIHYQQWTTLAFIVSFLIHRPRRLTPVRHEGRLLVLLWIFIGIGALSATWAVVSAQTALTAINEMFKTMLVTSLLVCVIHTERQMSILMTACLVGVFHASVAQTFGVRFGYVPAAFGAEFGVLPDTQSPVIVLFVPTLVITAMTATSKWERALSWFILPFALNSVVCSYRRTYFLALVFQLSLILLLLPKRILLKILPALIAGVCLFVFRLTPPDYWQRMQTIENPTQESSANERFIVSGASLRMLLDHPMGVGYRNYPDVSPRYLPAWILTDGRRSAHNSFFSIACETGFLGFGVWISAFIGAIFLCRRIRKKANFAHLTKVDIYAMGIEIGLYGWFLGGLTEADHEVDPAYWFVALAIILTRLQFQRLCDMEAESEERIEVDGEIAEQVSALEAGG
jgi:hypothetical protein